MSSKLCVYAFLAVLIFALVVIIVWIKAKPDAGSLTAIDTLEEIRNSPHLGDKVFAFLLYLTRFVSKGLFGFVLAMSLAAFTCLGAICVGDSVEELKVVRLILQDLYSFLARILTAG